MIHFVATTEVVGGTDKCPDIVPTHKLCCTMLVALAMMVGLRRRATGFFVSKEALETVRACSEFPYMASMFFVPFIDEQSGLAIPRYDWVKGKWVARPPGDAMHEFAGYEDATIADLLNHDSRVIAKIRFRRVMTIPENEFTFSE